ncbi:hypothetical protein P691DRAFT_812924 [Macrolepiota fuliginosa MF-IS2]|uniref:Uncharacterized protein n=1 Tax=Macrolepiota fuliginosa MF-IS2 TaxID=1400762 RepID=A0A9P5WYH3_9AGAR|nr:hypothetical protein P691DRAFT_812924 [Macrolepiota fuliginosa MF-IS2]
MSWSVSLWMFTPRPALRSGDPERQPLWVSAAAAATTTSGGRSPSRRSPVVCLALLVGFHVGFIMVALLYWVRSEGGCYFPRIY